MGDPAPNINLNETLQNRQILFGFLKSQNHSLVFRSMGLVIVRYVVVILISYVLSYKLICQLQNIISFKVYFMLQ